MYAHITNGVVDLVISVLPGSIFGQPYAAEFVPAPDDVAVGWLWDGQALTPPAPPALVQQYPRFVGNEKLDLFTPQEQMAVVTATMTDLMIKLMYDRLLGAAYLTYEDPETEQGLSLLVEKNLLTPERKSDIVALMQPR